jgi:hypothetical protein
MSFRFRSGTEVNAASNDIAFDLGKPQLDLIEPRGIGRSEMQMNLRVRREKRIDLLGLVCREVVGDDADDTFGGLSDAQSILFVGELWGFEAIESYRRVARRGNLGIEELFASSVTHPIAIFHPPFPRGGAAVSRTTRSMANS